jgi:hypothetical protein
MDSKQIKSLFIDFFGEETEIYGLFVNLIDVQYLRNEVFHFHFEISNPNDVSYCENPFEWEISEILKEFKQYVDIKYQFNMAFVDNDQPLYFNEQKKQEIEEAFKSVKSIKFSIGTPFLGNDEYVMNIRSVGFKKYHDDNEIYLENIVKVISATKNGENCDIDEATFNYYEEFLPNQENYWETEQLYIHLDAILSSIPSLGDNEIVYEYGTTLFHK